VRRISHPEGGVVLLTVLMAVLLLTVAVLSARSGVELAAAAARGEADRLQADALCRSGVALVQEAFAQDDPASDSYADDWALVNGQGAIPVGDLGLVTVRVEDEEGKFDLNWAVNQAGEADTRWGPRFVRLFTRAGVPADQAERMVAGLVDWIDADGTPSEGGAEEEYYASLPRPYTPRNGRLQTPGEAALVAGFTPPLLDSLSRLVTVYGNRERKVNANTAPAEVLYALSEEIDETLADDIVSFRKEAPFARVDELRSVPGMGQVYNSLAGLLTVSTSHVSVAVAGENLSVVSRCRAVLARAGKTARLVYYRAF
jgi:general secretion pathway protein K